jgi:hypothetical protein
VSAPLWPWLLAALLGLVSLVLLCPWHLRVAGTTAPPTARVELRLVAGLAPAIRLPLGQRGRATDTKAQRRRPRARRRGPPRETAALIRGILQSMRLRRLSLSGRIGLDDPAETGQLWALIVPLAHLLGGPRRRIDLVPEFAGPCLDLEASGEIAVRPLRLIRAGAAFALANGIRP